MRFRFLVEPYKDAAKIGLTEDSIRNATERHLFDLYFYSLYSNARDHNFHVNINVVGCTFCVGLRHEELVCDPDPLSRANACSWNWKTPCPSYGATGTHGGNAGSVLSSISRLMGRFLDEYYEYYQGL